MMYTDITRTRTDIATCDELGEGVRLGRTKPQLALQTFAGPRSPCAYEDENPDACINTDAILREITETHHVCSH